MESLRNPWKVLRIPQEIPQESSGNPRKPQECLEVSKDSLRKPQEIPAGNFQGILKESLVDMVAPAALAALPYTSTSALLLNTPLI